MASSVAKVALVTGASSGIGRATALRFSAAGYRTVITDVKEHGGQETVQLIQQQNSTAHASFFKADVSKEHDIQELMHHIKSTYGRLDAAFNNAGIDGGLQRIVDMTVEDFDRVIDINLKGVFLCMKHEIPLMLENGGGAIVNCSSVAGKRGVEMFPAYVASKHGVLGLTKCTALEMATHNIRINAVCPGLIHTPMTQNIEGIDMDEFIKSNEPMQREGRPEEVADAVVFLCGDGASFITGTTLDVDGGWMAK